MSGCSQGGRVAWLLAALALAGGAPARAADAETRDFSVLISGRPSGEVHMTIQRQDATTVAVRCDTDIRVKFGLISYKFVYRGLEVWKDRRLARLDSSTDDNGKRYIVSAAGGPGGLAVRVNNAERAVSPDVWVTSYWSLPDPRLRDKTLTLLDADSGKVMTGRLSFVANERVRVAGQEVPLNHYRLTGQVNVDLWYDGAERLVRQAWVEQGHATVLELVRVRR